jgi:two-component system NtrC family sensor kinase
VPLSRGILEKIAKTFQIDKAAIFLADPTHADFFRLAYAVNVEMTPNMRFYRKDNLLNRQNSNDLYDAKEGANYLYRANSELNTKGLCYSQDLKLHNRDVGMIALGQLPHDRHFSTEDLELLAALAGYAAIALENANLYRSVEVKARELEHLKAYTENIIESINVAILALDLNGRITS